MRHTDRQTRQTMGPIRMAALQQHKCNRANNILTVTYMENYHQKFKCVAIIIIIITKEKIKVTLSNQRRCRGTEQN